MGTTASGKSQWALSQCLQHQKKSETCAILNCDSIQVYSGLRIGSALPSPEEMQLAPHFLFSYVPVGDSMTVGLYYRDFFAWIEKNAPDFQYLYVVGGTGFYFQALENGLHPIGPVDHSLRKALELEIQKPGVAQSWHRELAQTDAQAAKRIAVQDHYRMVRMREVWLETGKTPSQVAEKFLLEKRPFPYPLHKVGVQVSLSDLQKRVSLRTRQMLKQGLVDEVEDLLGRGLELWEPLQSVGYREVKAFLRQEPVRSQIQKTITDLQSNIVTSTLQLAKKQRTWFSRDLDIRWRDGG